MGENNGNRLLRMVIVDGDRRSRIHVREYLNEMGVRVIGEVEDHKAGLRLVKGLQPDAIVLELPQHSAETMDTLRSIREEQPETAIILTSHESSPQLILDCIRAGAQEFITRPVDPKELRKAVDHVQSLAHKIIGNKKKRGMIISVFAGKGGVGATSVVTNLGVALTNGSRAKTILVDLSLYMGELGLMLDQPPKYSLADTLDKGELDEMKLQSAIAHHNSGVHVLTCVTSPEMSAEITCDHLMEVIGTLSTMYEFVIIDVGRHLDDRTVDVLMLSDEILLLASQDITTVRNASRYLDIFERLELDSEKIHLIVNRYHKRSRVPLKDLETALEMDTFWSIPNDYEPMSRAIDAGVPAVIEAPRSKVAQSFKDLAEHIMELHERQSVAEPVSVAHE